MGKTRVSFGRWQAVRIDSLNWQLFEHAELKSGKRKGERDWVARSNYFARLVDAVAFARDKEFEQGGYDGSLDGAIEEMRKLDRRFLKAVKEAVGE